MSDANLSFEDSIQRLQEIVKKLQNGSIPLAEALELFQEGTGLITGATRMLDEAELRVQQFNAGSGAKEADDEQMPF